MKTFTCIILENVSYYYNPQKGFPKQLLIGKSYGNEILLYPSLHQIWQGVVIK